MSAANKLLIRCAWAGTSAFASAGYGSSWAPGGCPSQLFAVTTATKNAQTLPYGPGPIGGDVAYFCTDCIDTPSDSWTETVACDGSNVDMTLVYKFDSAMSVVDRMRQCAATGCNVAFTVSGPGITTTSFNSDWWFTDGTVLPSTSGSGVSSDDGMWGGAPGEVNGNGPASGGLCYGNAGTTRFYGFGNCNSGDTSRGATVYYGPNGSKQCPSLKAQLYATPPMDWKWPAEHNVDCKDYHPRIGGGQELVNGIQRSGNYNLAKACDSSSDYFVTEIGYGVNGADYVDFIFTFENANTWCSGYRQIGQSNNWVFLFTKDIEIYTGDASIGPWTKVATGSHSTWHNSNKNTFTDDGTTTEWTPTAPSKYLLVRTLTNHGDTINGGRLVVNYLQLKFSGPTTPVVAMAYTAGKDYPGLTAVVTGTATVIPGVTYHVKTEILRNDLGHSHEKVTSILVDGIELGECNPDGGDYDCTFFDCFSAQSHTVTATSTQLQFALSYQGHSWDCDCDTTTWESGDTSCSKESTIASRSPMTAVARFTLTPVHKLSSD